MKSRRKRKKKVAFLLVLVLCISIGYSFLSSSLNLVGQTSVKGNIWDVHFEDVAISDKSVSTTEEGKATISEDRQTVNFNVSLDKPGDFYEFTVYAVNAGTIDAMIDNLDKTIFTEEQAKVLDFKITSKTGKELNRLDGLRTNSKYKLKVVLKYKEDVDAETIKNVDIKDLEVKFTADFIQSDETVNFLAPANGPTMLNIGYGHNDSKLSELKSYYSNLSTVTLNDSINIPEGAPNWDISEAENGTVMAYVVRNETDSTKYDLHIEGEGGISAPIDSTELFQLSTSKHEKNAYTNIVGLNLLNTSEVTNMNYMFNYCGGLTSLDLSNFDTSKVSKMYFMFSNCSGLTSLDVSSFDTSQVTSMGGIFCNCGKLTKLDLDGFNISNVTEMSYMFNYCESLVSLDLNGFNISKVTDMSYMFRGCSGLTSLDLSSLDTSKVTNMASMFCSCSGLTSLDLSDFDTSQVTGTGMMYMFSNCSNLVNLDLSNFDTSKVTKMSSMFSDCSGLTSLDLTNFDTSNVTDMSGMFLHCSKLAHLNLSSFDTSNVTNMSDMFNWCEKLKSLDFRSASFDKVTSYSYMFNNVPSGIEIIVKDDTAKSWMLDKKSDATVKTVAEL